MKTYFVYILTNASRTLYTGVTNNLERRLYDHCNPSGPNSFTARYHVRWLVHYEDFSDIRDAIAREKQIKSWRRSKKIALIESTNPTWRDLSLEWEDWQS